MFVALCISNYYIYFLKILSSKFLPHYDTYYYTFPPIFNQV